MSGSRRLIFSLPNDCFVLVDQLKYHLIELVFFIVHLIHRIGVKAQRFIDADIVFFDSFKLRLFTEYNVAFPLVQNRVRCEGFGDFAVSGSVNGVGEYFFSVSLLYVCIVNRLF